MSVGIQGDVGLFGISPLLEKCEIELVSLRSVRCLSCPTLVLRWLFMIRPVDSGLIEDLLILVQEKKFSTWAGYSSPVTFRSRIVEIRLFAEKGISLVVDILHNLGPSATVLNAERSMSLSVKMLVVEVGDIVCIICPARWQLVLLVIRIALQSRNIVEAYLLGLLLIYRLQIFELFSFRRGYLNGLAQTHNIATRRSDNILLEVLQTLTIVQRDAPRWQNDLFGCVEGRKFFKVQLLERIRCWVGGGRHIDEILTHYFIRLVCSNIGVDSRFITLQTTLLALADDCSH